MKVRAAATPIALVLLAAGAAAYAWVVDRGAVSDADRATRRSDVLPSFRVDDVTRVELAADDKEPLTLERSRDSDGAARAWTMTTPRRETADAAAVDVLLRELEMAKRLRSVSEHDALGLDAPRVRGTVTVGDIVYRFALGADAAQPEGSAYMRLDGEGTFVVGRSLAVQLLRRADAYRDRTIVPLGMSETKRLAVRTGGASWSLDRQGASFRTASGLRASRAAVERVFAAIAGARAESFVDDAAADRATGGASAIAVTIEARDAGAAGVEIVVGDACAGESADVVVLRTAPTRIAACVPRAVVDGLRVDAGSLVDLHPVYAHADEISELTMAPRIDIARQGGGWRDRSREPGSPRDLSTSESESAGALVSAIADAQAADARKIGPDDRLVDAGTVVVHIAGGGVETLEVEARARDGFALAHRLDDDALLRLAPAVARRLRPHPVALRDRSAWRVPFDAGSVVAIESTCGPLAQQVDLRGGTWTMRAPRGTPADPPSIAALAIAAAQAKVDAWIAEEDDGAFGFGAAASCVLALAIAPPSPDAGAPRRATLTFGATGDGGVYARTSDDAAVFVVPQALRDLASRSMIEARRD